MEDILNVPAPSLLMVKSLVLIVLITVWPKSQLEGITEIIGTAGDSLTITLSIIKSLSPSVSTKDSA